MKLSHFFQRNWLWMAIVSFSLLVVVSSSFLDPMYPLKLSVYAGVFFLYLTLLPANTLSLLPTQLRPLAAQLLKYRRSFGVSTGALFIIHAISAIWAFAGLRPSFLLSLPILFGGVALDIFVLILLTSNETAMRLLKLNWKKIQRLVWAALPLFVIHGFWAKLAYEMEISKFAILGGLLVVMVPILSFFYAHQKAQPYLQTLTSAKSSQMVALGFGIAVIIALVGLAVRILIPSLFLL